MFVSLADINLSDYHTIIAGSGPAGAAVAARLSMKGRRCLILETGGAEFDGNIQNDFRAMGGRGHYDGAHWASHWVRALGGTSAVWGGWCAPLLKRNFTNWPITRKDIDDYYVLASEFLLRDPAFLSFAPPYVENFDFRPFADGQPARFGRNYKPYQDDQNIHVLVKTSLAALTPRPDRRSGNLALLTRQRPHRL